MGIEMVELVRQIGNYSIFFGPGRKIGREREKKNVVIFMLMYLYILISLYNEMDSIVNQENGDSPFLKWLK